MFIVIILDPLLGRKVVVDQRSANAPHLICADGSSNAASADGDASLYLAGHNCSCEWNYEIRIVVDRVPFIGAKVNDGVSRGAEAGNQFLLQAESTVIRRDAYLHTAFFPCFRQPLRRGL
jgi:hypothetical protein